MSFFSKISNFTASGIFAARYKAAHKAAISDKTVLVLYNSHYGTDCSDISRLSDIAGHILTVYVKPEYSALSELKIYAEDISSDSLTKKYHNSAEAIKLCRKLASSSIIITNTPLPEYYLKRKEQTVIFAPANSLLTLLTTDNRTKVLSEADYISLLTDSQRTLFQADYLVFDNVTEDIIHNCHSFLPFSTSHCKVLYSVIFTQPENNKIPDLVPYIYTGISASGKNIVFFCSDLMKNGMTTSMLNLCATLDTSENNYYFLIKSSSYLKNKEDFDALPDGFTKLFIKDSFNNGTIYERLCHRLYFRYDITTAFVFNTVCKSYEAEYLKRFYNARFSGIIHYTGYAQDFLMLFAPAKCKRAVMVHNDMKAEYSQKHNFHMPSLKYAYKVYDYVLPVSSAVYNSLIRTPGPLIKPENTAKSTVPHIQILENAHNHNLVIKLSGQPLETSPDTNMNISADELSCLLNSHKKIFITIGRFSSEKGHDRLINAFIKLHAEYADTALIIVGGYGDLYDNVTAALSELSASGCAAVIRSLPNPFPLLAACDCFVLPSLREPLGLVMLEADSLSLPLVVPDIPGAGSFIKEHGGIVFDNSEEGLLIGMKMFMHGQLPCLNIDYPQYNKKIAEKFTKLF